MTINQHRRRLLSGLGLLAIAPAVKTAAMLKPTPRQTAGPFYPVELPLDDDNDLTYVNGEPERAKGEWTDLTGRILDINAKPLSGMRIEIWQCDINGRYRHPYDDAQRPLDPGFQGHGHTLSNQQGQYRFRTIKPEKYPGRTPHIHVAVFPENEQPFTTQIYIAGDPRNDRDGLYNRIPVEKRKLVVADFKPVKNPEVSLEASFDIILHVDSGTPGA